MKKRATVPPMTIPAIAPLSSPLEDELDDGGVLTVCTDPIMSRGNCALINAVLIVSELFKLTRKLTAFGTDNPPVLSRMKLT